MVHYPDDLNNDFDITGIPCPNGLNIRVLRPNKEINFIPYRWLDTLRWWIVRCTWYYWPQSYIRINYAFTYVLNGKKYKKTCRNSTIRVRPDFLERIDDIFAIECWEPFWLDKQSTKLIKIISASFTYKDHGYKGKVHFAKRKKSTIRKAEEAAQQEQAIKAKIESQ